jgi:hypothetical protein
MVILLIALQSTHMRHEPSFLGTKITGTAQGLRDSCTYPLSDASLDTKVITKHLRRNKKTHKAPFLLFLVFFLFLFFLLQLFFDIFFKVTSKLNSRTKRNASNEQMTTHTFSGEGRGKRKKRYSPPLSLSQKYGLLRFKQKVYSDWGSKSLPQTEVVLRLEQKV